MHVRSQQMADRVAVQLDLTTQFLAGLDDRELRVSCHDEGGGPTVGAVVLHIVAGFRRASAMFTAAGSPNRRGADQGRRAEPMAGFAGGRRSAEGRSADLEDLGVAEALRRLRTEGELALETLGRLPDRLLDAPLPPEVCSIADVGKPVSLVVEFIVYQQAVHLDMMQRAVTAARADTA